MARQTYKQIVYIDAKSNIFLIMTRPRIDDIKKNKNRTTALIKTFQNKTLQDIDSVEVVTTNKQKKQNAYLGDHQDLFAHLLWQRVTICAESFTYFNNFVLHFLTRVEYQKYIFLNLHNLKIRPEAALEETHAHPHPTYIFDRKYSYMSLQIGNDKSLSMMVI